MKKWFLLILLVPLFLSGEIFDVSIYDIQYVENPTVNDSSQYVGDTVRFDGVVTGVFSGNGYFVQDSSAKWCGVYVFTNSTSVLEGDSVQITGIVSEYYNLTEIDPIEENVLKNGVDLPEPILIGAGEMEDEGLEGLYVELRNLEVTNNDLGYGEWQVTDSTGNGRVDDLAGYSYSPSNGDSVYVLKGILTYSYSNYKVEPRYDEDIITNPVMVWINPYYVAPSDTVFMRISAYSLGDDISNIKIYLPETWTVLFPDSIGLHTPSSSTGYAVVDSDSVSVSWNMIDTADSCYATFYIVADTIDGKYAFPIDIKMANDVSLHPFDTLYIEIKSSIFDSIMDIEEVQKPGDDGYTSAYENSTVKVRGFVTGSSYKFSPTSSSTGGYIQDATAGVNIYSSNGYIPWLKEGMEIVLEGTVTEYNGLTEIKFDDETNITVISDTNTVIEPETLFVSQVLSEDKEGGLYAVRRGQIITAPVLGGSGYNMQLWNGRAVIDVRINNTTQLPYEDIFNELLPGQYIDITGIVGQYDKNEPYSSGYQLMPRGENDIQILSLTDTLNDGTRIEFYPNPVNPYTGEIMRFNVYSPTNARVYLTVYDKKGREVSRILVNRPGGDIMVDWNVTDDTGKQVEPGIYLLDLQIQNNDGTTDHIRKPIVVAF